MSGQPIPNNEAHLDRLLEGIAKKHLSIDTLVTQKSDSLDFHDCAVWCIKSALKEAFELGQRVPS